MGEMVRCASAVALALRWVSRFLLASNFSGNFNFADIWEHDLRCLVGVLGLLVEVLGRLDGVHALEELLGMWWQFGDLRGCRGLVPVGVAVCRRGDEP